jgi:hypothetical protein
MKSSIDHSLQLRADDLLSTSHTKLKLVKSVNHQENDGHEEDQTAKEQIIGFIKQTEAGMPRQVFSEIYL